MTCVAFAQSENTDRQGRRPNPEQMAQQFTERMASRYGLDDTQKASLLELNKQYAAKMPRMGGRHGGRPGMGPRPDGVKRDSTFRPRLSKEDMEKRHKEMEANREAYNASLKKIMTESQYKQYTDDQAKMRERHGGPQQKADK